MPNAHIQTSAWQSGSGSGSVFGAGSANASVSANNSSAIGVSALAALTSGANNTALGNKALISATTASNNVAVGYRAAYQNQWQTAITVVGADALFNNNSTGYHTAIGYQALFAFNGSGAAFGATAIGAEAGYSATSANSFTAIGRRAGYSHTTGADCTYIGYSSGYSGLAGANTGEGLTAIGPYALGHNTTGSYNTAVGRAAQWYNTTGSQRTSIGYRAGYCNTAGYDTVEIGFYAGHNSQGSGRNVLIGSRADIAHPAVGSWSAVATTGSGLSNASLLYSYRVAFVIDGVEQALSEPIDASTVAGSGSYQITHSNLPLYTGPRSCTARRLYRTPGHSSGVAEDNLYYLVSAIADNTTTTFVDSVPDGSLGAAPVSPSGSVCLGHEATANKGGQVVIGSPASRITEMYVGGGIDDLSPARLLFSASGASGGNLSSGGMRISGGQSTGSAVGGSVILSASRPGSAGSSINPLIDLIEVFPNGHAFMANVSSAPSGTPSGGGWLFVESGALKFKGSAGTVTTLAPP